MKLSQPLTGDYDPATKIFRLTGKNSVGRTSGVEFSVEDPNVFFGWLAAVLFEKSYTQSGGGKGLNTDHIQLGMHRDDGGEHALSFTFTSGQMRLTFVAPIRATAPERLQSIQGHLEQALAEMGQSAAPTRQ